MSSSRPMSIPDRTSSKFQSPSKRKALPSSSADFQDDSDGSDDIAEKKDKLKNNIKNARKKLKNHGSFDSEYWAERSIVASKERSLLGLRAKLSRRNFEAQILTEEDFQEQAKQYQGELQTFESDLKIYEKREKEMAVESKCQTTRREYFNLFLKTIGIGRGKRDSKQQSTFRKGLIEDYGAAHPTKKGMLWCTVSGGYYGQENITAAHIFPAALDQITMTAIFQTKDELFTSRNGLLMRTDLETRFDKHMLAIVPYADISSAKEVQDWTKSKPQRWMIQVMNNHSAQMKLTLEWDQEKTFADLNGTELAFRTSFRPRARYLYFHYLVALLKKCYHDDKHETITKEHAGRPVWATAGKYMGESMLLAFVEQIGHKELLANAIPDNNGKGKVGEVDELALEAANATIRFRPLRSSGVRQRDVEESTDDEEEEAEDSDSDSYGC